MKCLVSMIVALGLAVAFTVPAFAGPGSLPQTKADCEKVGKMWDEANKKCVESSKRPRLAATAKHVRGRSSTGPFVASNRCRDSQGRYQGKELR